ncbi:hypothetical protein CWI84_11725, partial [Idiomarina tyrosinivorans]
MKKAEIIKYLKGQYKAKKVDSDWEFILKDDGEGYLAFFPGTFGTGSTRTLLGMPSMTLPWLLQLDRSIFFSESQQVVPFFVGRQCKLSVSDGIIREHHVDEMVENCFEWFHQQNQQETIATEFSRCYEKITGFPPAGWQPKHIMACVLKGDVDRLRGYLDAFKRGDRMEFIPIIKQEYFERAIPLAEKYRSG